MDYAAVSTAVADHIRLASGEDIGVRLGGAGIYAWSDCASGRSPAADPGVGEDFPAIFGAGCKKAERT
jgi:hypothetical protein